MFAPSLYLHCLVLDGVYRRTEGEPFFDEARAPTDDELKGLIDQIVARLMKLLTRRGYLVEEQGMTYLQTMDADHSFHTHTAFFKAARIDGSRWCTTCILHRATSALND